ncbi:MAG: ABC transporter substrate-binding protein [Nocardioidaceae bacterium]
MTRHDRGGSPLWTPNSPQGLDRRSVLKGAAALGGLAAVPSLAACGEGGGSSGGAHSASLGSNFSDKVPKKALAAVLDGFEKAEGVTVDINTVDHESFQENITSYLQGGPDDVLAWFAGYRMRFFAKQGYLADINDLWSEWGGDYSAAFKQASTGADGNQYFVPFYYYPWAVFYRKSLFAEKGYSIPKTIDDFTALCKEMASDGLTPIAFADKEGWPALGTFDVLNFRKNGYDFHMSLMRGEESWDDDRVKAVFSTWRDLLPYHQKGALGKDWLDSAAGLVNKKAGMMYLGMFIGQAFTNKEDHEDLDYFPFPEINPEYGQDTIDAPIDGWLLAQDPSNEDSAKKLLSYFASTGGQEIYLKLDPNNVAANVKADTSHYNALQKKAVKTVGSAKHISQFLDRDTDPSFASNVMIAAVQKFLNNPKDIDGLTASIEKQAKTIFDK